MGGVEKGNEGKRRGGRPKGQGTVKGLIVYAICFASILSLLLIFRRVRRR